MTETTKSVLFVCLGNICRSPAAEGVAKRLADERALGEMLRIDSAGTSGYHDGSAADARMRSAAHARGIALDSRSRRVEPRDFLDFDWIVAMDRDNYRDLSAESPPGATAELCLFSDFAGEPWPTDVPDPYYGGPLGFEEVLDMLQAGMPRLIDSLLDGTLNETPNDASS